MKVLSTLGVIGVLKVVLPAWEAASGEKVEASYDPTAIMLERIRGGERADLAFLTTDGVDTLIAEGIMLPGSRVDLARSLVGLAVKSGAPKPDLSTVESTRAALLAAPSIVYSRKGQSGIFFASVLERLGIADEVNAKAIIVESGTTAREVVAGRATIAVQQVSELMLVSGVDIAGPLPPGIQDDLVFAGGVFAGSRAAAEAASLIAAMAAPGLAPVYAAKGLQALGRA
jgi:molybdate transport system substrate-binding protein